MYPSAIGFFVESGHSKAGKLRESPANCRTGIKILLLSEGKDTTKMLGGGHKTRYQTWTPTLAAELLTQS